MPQLPAFSPGVPPSSVPGGKESRAVNQVLENVGEWSTEPSRSVLKLKDGSELPVTLYPAKSPATPDLAVLSTSRSVCGEEVPTCLSTGGRTLFLGSSELESASFSNKLLFPKKSSLSQPERESVQRGAVRFQLTLAETRGDLFKAYESLLKEVRGGKAPEPKETMSLIFRSRPLEDYLYSALCLSKGDSGGVFMPGGKAYRGFVEDAFKEARNRLSLLDLTDTERLDYFKKFKELRDGQLNPESKITNEAYEKARTRYAALGEKR